MRRVTADLCLRAVGLKSWDWPRKKKKYAIDSFALVVRSIHHTNITNTQPTQTTMEYEIDHNGCHVPAPEATHRRHGHLHSRMRPSGYQPAYERPLPTAVGIGQLVPPSGNTGGWLGLCCCALPPTAAACCSTTGGCLLDGRTARRMRENSFKTGSGFSSRSHTCRRPCRRPGRATHTHQTHKKRYNVWYSCALVTS